jgi:hypothetical protein
MDEDPFRQRAVAANRKKQIARRNWKTSQERAWNFLAAIEYQIAELKDIRRIGGEGALNGNVSAGIEALERDAANVRAEIPELPPGW